MYTCNFISFKPNENDLDSPVVVVAKNYFLTRMHSSRMRTTRSSSRRRGGGGGEVGQSPFNFSLGVGLDQIPLNFPLGFGPGPDPVPGPRGGAWSWEGVSRLTTKGEIEGDLVQAHNQGGSWGGSGPGQHPREKLRAPGTRHPPVNRITDTCKNITLPQTLFAGGKKWKKVWLIQQSIR